MVVGGWIWRSDSLAYAVPCRQHGAQYGSCVAVHAEQNALINASAQDLRGATIYLAGYDVTRDCWIEVKVCNICDRMIRNAGIVRVVGRTVVR